MTQLQSPSRFVARAKRYERIYKKEPGNLRAIVGMAAAYEDMQRYADAVRIWLRYSQVPLPAADKADADRMLAGARDLFAAYGRAGDKPTTSLPSLRTSLRALGSAIEKLDRSWVAESALDAGVLPAEASAPRGEGSKRALFKQPGDAGFSVLFQQRGRLVWAFCMQCDSLCEVIPPEELGN